MATAGALQNAQQKLEHLVDQRSRQLAVAEQELVRNERFRALGQMASGIAHELNNGLVPITSYAELLSQSDNLTTEQRDWVHNIAAASGDAANVVHSLQLFHGKGPGRRSREVIDPGELVRQVVDLTRPVWKDSADARGIRIQVETHFASTPHIRVNASELRQVLTNLVLNSADAIQNDGTISLSLKSRANHVEFQVSDNGCGMTSDQLESCLDPFFTTKPQGVGLGLSVCRAVIERHGGQMEVTSAPNVGTTFTLSFPVDHCDECAARGERVGLLGIPPGQSLKVLYVEDNANVRSSFALLLRRVGLEVVTADSGEQAVSLAKAESNFDLLIVDMGMPDMNGAETIAALANQGMAVPTVVVSGWSIQTVLDGFAQQQRPDYVLTKPVKLEKLAQVVNDVRARLAKTGSET